MPRREEPLNDEENALMNDEKYADKARVMSAVAACLDTARTVLHSEAYTNADATEAIESISSILGHFFQHALHSPTPATVDFSSRTFQMIVPELTELIHAGNVPADEVYAIAEDFLHGMLDSSTVVEYHLRSLQNSENPTVSRPTPDWVSLSPMSVLLIDQLSVTPQEAVDNAEALIALTDVLAQAVSYNYTWNRNGTPGELFELTALLVAAVRNGALPMVDALVAHHCLWDFSEESYDESYEDRFTDALPLLRSLGETPTRERALSLIVHTLNQSNRIVDHEEVSALLTTKEIANYPVSLLSMMVSHSAGRCYNDDPTDAESSVYLAHKMSTVLK